MKFIITLLLSSLVLCSADEKSKNSTETFKKKVEKVDKIIVRDGGNICCVTRESTLEQEIYITVTDKETIQKLIDSIEFVDGKEKNSCLCCGHPGIDFYVGDKRVLLSSWKHGYGLFSGNFVFNFTKESKKKVASWLIENKVPDKRKEFENTLNSKD